MVELRRFLTATLCVAAMAFCMPASAQEQEDHSSLTIGAGVAMVPRYEGSDEYRVLPLPQVRGRVNDFSFWTRGPSLYFDALPDRDPDGWDVELGPVVGARFDRSSSKTIKDMAVQALGKRDVAVEVGGFAGFGKAGVITSPYDNLSARVAVVKDVAGAHDSFVVTPQIEYFTPLSVRSFVGLGVSAEYVGKKYGRYYFDIDPAQAAASGLSAYDRAGEKAGFRRINTSIAGGYSLSGDLRHGWALFAVGSYARLLGRYADSPIVADVGSKNQWIGAVGIGYTF